RGRLPDRRPQKTLRDARRTALLTLRALLEEDGDALAMGDAPDRLAEQAGDRDDLDLRRERVRLCLDAVGDEEALDRAAVEPLVRGSGEQPVADGGPHGCRSPLDEDPGRVDEGPCRDREVVDDERAAPL